MVNRTCYWTFYWFLRKKNRHWPISGTFLQLALFYKPGIICLECSVPAQCSSWEIVLRLSTHSGCGKKKWILQTDSYCIKENWLCCSLSTRSAEICSASLCLHWPLSSNCVKPLSLSPPQPHGALPWAVSGLPHGGVLVRLSQDRTSRVFLYLFSQADY